ncbi:MAG: hypothetical protein ACOH2Q_23540 [Rhodococcus sp. (in: high G+C Gram-positive bacteria)]
MKTRSSIGSVLLTVVAVATLSACGSNGTAAAPLAPTSTTTAIPAASASLEPSPSDIASPADTGAALDQPEPDTTLDDTGPAPETVPAESIPAHEQAPEPEPAQSDPVSSTGASNVLGHWQRHASTLDLEDVPPMSTLSMGASCCDTENWSVTWTPTPSGVNVTLLARTFLAGSGVDGMLYEGKSFSAKPTIGYNGTPVLITYGLGDDPGISTWCRSGQGVPECGA